MAVIRLAVALAVSIAASGCGEKRANKASCLRSLDLCVHELAVRGCAGTPTMTTAIATTPAIDRADAGAGMNEASCPLSHRRCRERLAACPLPTAPAPR